MKIGIELQRIFRSSKHGMDVVAIELIRCLQQADKYNQYTLFSKKGADESQIAETGNFHFNKISGAGYAYWEQIALPLEVKKIKPDLLHCTANTAPLFCPVPLVLTLHDIIYLQETNFQGSAYQNFGNIYRRLIVPHAIKQAKRIITVSEHEKSVIAGRCSIDPEKITVIHNAAGDRFHRDYAKQDLDDFRRKYRLPAEYILHLGNTASKKNTAGMIRAYVHYCSSVNKPLPIVIADYPEKKVMRILDELNRKDLIGRFTCPGYMTVQEMPRLYNCAALFIYPSLQESFGLPVLEAMSCGIPVIASHIPALKEVANDAAVFIDPESHINIANSIALVLQDSQLRNAYIEKGLARAGQFSWKKSAEKLLQVYQTTSMASP